MAMVTVIAEGPEGSVAVSFDTLVPAGALLVDRGVGRRLVEAYQLVFETSESPTLSARPIPVEVAS